MGGMGRSLVHRCRGAEIPASDEGYRGARGAPAWPAREVLSLADRAELGGTASLGGSVTPFARGASLDRFRVDTPARGAILRAIRPVLPRRAGPDEGVVRPPAAGGRSPPS